MKRIKKALVSLAIASMALTLIPLNVFAESAVPTRLGGYTAAQTAVQIAEQTGWTGTAILASSASYGMVDALTAGPLATFLKAPILLTEGGDVLNSDTQAELTKLQVKTVYVTSGTGVIHQKVLDQLAGMNITVVPLGGVDRFATSANIANKMVELGAKVSKAAVAYGWLNQDALSIASIASAQTEPILLTEKDSIPDSVEAFLTTNTSVKTTDVIGGTGVISEAVKAQLPSATRYFGNTAYDTNLAVLKAFDSVLKYDHVFIANGETAIDALAGAPLAAKYHAGIVLTNGVANDATTYVTSKLSATSVVTAIGGTAVVPDAVRAGTVYTPPTGGGGGGTAGGGSSSGGGGTAGGGSSSGGSGTAGGGSSSGSGGGSVTTTTYDTPGTVGPASGTQTISGNVLVTVAGVTLQNLNITGNFEIASSVGSGDVTLDNVTVAGQTTVKGGGQNSIHIKNSHLTGALVVIKLGTQVRIVAEGSTSISNVQLQSGVILQGNFSSVTLDVPGVAVTVQSGTVGAFTVGSNAAGTTIEVGAGASVSAITLNSGITVTGTGAIGTAVINAGGTTIAQTPASTTVASTVTGGANVGGSIIQAGETIIGNAEEQFLAKIMATHSSLDDNEKASLRSARSALTSVTDSQWDTIVSPLKTPEVITRFGTEANAKAALIQFIQNFSALYYSDDMTTLEATLNTFKANNSATFRTLFGNDFTMDQFYSYLIATQNDLPSIITSNPISLIDVLSGTSADLKDQIVVWTKAALHQVGDPVGQYHIFNTKLSELGLNVDMLVDAQRQLGTVIDPANSAEKTLVLAGIRSQILCTVPTQVIINQADTQFDIGIKDFDLGDINLANLLVWDTTDHNVATISMNANDKPVIHVEGRGTTYVTATKNGNKLVNIMITVK